MLKGIFNYAVSLFNSDSIERMAQHYINVLESIANNQKQKIKEISLLTPEEYQKTVLDWNKTERDFPKGKTLPQLFEAQVTKTPDNVAVVFEDQSLTYRELNEKSNQLARYIRKQYKKNCGKELEPDTLIALCLDRSFDMIVAILAILKAGAAYVPIDPEYPEERIRYILDDTQSTIIITNPHFKDFKQPTLKYIKLGNECYAKEPIDNLMINLSPEDLAYVIYTSGTTGNPKG